MGETKRARRPSSEKPGGWKEVRSMATYIWGVKHGTELSYNNTQYLSNKREPRRDDKKKKSNLAAACGI